MTEDVLRYAIEMQRICLDITLKKLAIAQEDCQRLRAELDAERTKHQELWRLVDKELDRIYADAKGVDQ